MMNLLLILFFTSLISILIMIGRKLFLLQNGQISGIEGAPFEVPHLEKVKHFTIKNIKKYEHILLVEMLRFYIKFSNLLKKKYQDMKIKVKNIIIKNERSTEKKEISKFLKVIGDYKNKIREIKHRIKKEENL